MFYMILCYPLIILWRCIGEDCISPIGILLLMNAVASGRRSRDRSRVTIATGFSGHGFGIGPAAGELAADLVMSETPLVDPEPFRFSRFSDGSCINPIIGI